VGADQHGHHTGEHRGQGRIGADRSVRLGALRAELAQQPRPPRVLIAAQQVQADQAGIARAARQRTDEASLTPDQDG
jgi:hypothetical protein